MSRTRQFGFTLVELLVVIAIMSTLMVLLLPGAMGAKEKANSAKCQTNLRELYKAFSMYLADEGVYPEDMNTPPPADNPYAKAKWVGWDSCINKYMRYKINEGVRRCPTANSYHRKTGNSLCLNGQIKGKAFGGSKPGRRPMPAERVSKTIMLADGKWNGKTLWADNGSWGGIDYAGSRPDFEHNGNSNFIFCDGHVRAMNASIAVQPYLWDPINYPEPDKPLD